MKINAGFPCTKQIFLIIHMQAGSRLITRRFAESHLRGSLCRHETLLSARLVKNETNFHEKVAFRDIARCTSEFPVEIINEMPQGIGAALKSINGSDETHRNNLKLAFTSRSY